MTRIRPGFDAYDNPADGSENDLRLTELLNEWAIWMHTGTYGRGYPRKSPGLQGHTRGSDFDEMRRQGLSKTAEKVDAAVNELPHNERIAILRAYALTTDVWRFRQSWEELEARARKLIREKLRRRGVE